MYSTAGNDPTDLAKPNSPSGFSVASGTASWTNGSDVGSGTAGANATGVQGTIILTSNNAGAASPGLLDQGYYVIGTAVDADWTVATDVASSTLSYAVSGTPAKVAAVHYDKAYNYSTAALYSPSYGPAKLGITPTPSGVVSGTTFSVTVQSQDAGSNASNVAANTDFSFSVATGAGSLGGSVSGTITAGTNSATVSGVTYTITGGETGVSLTATRTAGDNLTAGTSSTFTVMAEEPTIASTISFGTATGTTIPIAGLNGGDGSSRIVVVKSGAGGVDWSPTDGAIPSGIDPNFVGATDQGSGNKVVYDGSVTTNPVTVTNLSVGTTYSFAIFEYNGSGAARNYRISSPGTGSQATAATPTLTVSRTSIAFPSLVVNSVSAESTFTVSGAFLTPASGDITVTAPAGFEVSLSSGSGFGSSVLASYTGGTLGSTTIYVRFAPTAVQTYSGNVTNAGGGASTQNVAVSGTGLDYPAVTLASANPAVAAGSVSLGSSKNPLCKFTLAVTNSDAELNQVAFTSGGTYAAADVTKFQLWYKSSDDLATATKIGFDITSSLDAGPHQFTGLTQIISAAATGYFWITADVAGGAAPGNTINISALTTSDLTFSSGTKSGSTSAGGDQTITVTSNATDFFRSVSTGAWSSTTTWESSADSASWHAASLVPTSSASGIAIRSGDTVAISSAVTLVTSYVENGAVLAVETGGTLTVAAAKTMTVAGTLLNAVHSSNPFTISGTMVVTPTGLFNLTAPATTGATYIPTATWQSGSTCTISGLIGTVNPNPVDYNGLTGLAQTFSNFTIDVPNLIGKFNVARTITSGFSVGGVFTINSSGSSTYGIQITSSSGMNVVTNGGSYVQNGGLVSIIHNSSNTTNKGVTWAGDFTLNGGTFNIAAYSTGGGTSTLTVGGNIAVANGATLQKSTQFGTAGKTMLLLNGASGNQTMTFGSTPLTGAVSIAVNKSSGNLLLGSSLTIDTTMTLTSGDVDLNGHTLTLSANGSLSESSGNTVKGNGTITTTRNLSSLSTATNVGGMGAVMSNGPAYGSTVITRGHTVQTGNGNHSIARFLEITPTLNTSLNTSFTFKYDSTELGDIPQANLVPFKSTDNGATWTQVEGTLDSANHQVTITGVNDFSRWTLGNSGAPLPVELTNFTASASGLNVTLRWSTASETDNAGFEIERSENSGISGQKSWNRIGYIPGAGSTSSMHEYSLTDRSSGPGRFAYRLKQVDKAGSSKYSASVEVEVGSCPRELALYGNYPNPFNPSTKISFSVPDNGRAHLRVFNLIGQEVADLFNGEVQAGVLKQVTFDAGSLPTGLYVARLEFGNKVVSSKLVLTK